MRALIVLGFLLLSLFAGCAKPPEPQAALRPVRVFRVGDHQTAGGQESFAGEVKARYESKLAFRVPGKIIARLVEIGDRVRKGQPLAQLDASDYRLASKSLSAQLEAARAERDFIKDDIGRYHELLDLKYISQAEYDRRETADKTASDRVEALHSQLNQANNQTSYTILYADRGGIVTGLDAEAGQVVGAGQEVVRVAQLEEKEVLINVPENRVAQLRNAAEADVSLWADGDRRLKGRIREISPGADPASRTYAVKLSLLDGNEFARLGMTATVYFPTADAGSKQPAIPLTAVFQPQHDTTQARVWVVDEQTNTVKSVPVKLGALLAGQQVTASGIAPGQLVVSAGVTRLLEGQAVRLLGAENRPALAETSTARVAAGPAARAQGGAE